MALDYNRTIETFNHNESVYEIKVTSPTNIYWGIFKDGKKLTDFMNCQGSCAPQLIQEYFKKKLGIDRPL